MGYMRHHAIIVTSHHEHLEEVHTRCLVVQETFNEELFAEAKEKSRYFSRDEVDQLHLISNVYESKTNGIASFLIQPDGSKEGWDRSKLGAQLRKRIKDKVLRPEEKEYGLNWVEVQFGDDENMTMTVECNDCGKENSIEAGCLCTHSVELDLEDD